MLSVNNLKFIILFLIVPILTLGLFSCDAGNNNIKFRQYFSNGRSLYISNCSNCHQKNGEGLAGLYPPLTGSSSAKPDTIKEACIIRHGLSGRIIVNGKEYNTTMPPNEKLTSLEIAEILTYVNNSWGKKKGIYTVAQVQKQLSECE